MAVNPFYDANSLYGLQNSTFWNAPFNLQNQNAWLGTDAGQSHALGDQEAYYLRLFGDYDPYSMQGNFLEQSARRAQMGYRQAIMTNPDLKPSEYYPGIAAGTNAIFRTLGPEQQGYNYNRYAPAAQRIPRGF